MFTRIAVHLVCVVILSLTTAYAADENSCGVQTQQQQTQIGGAYCTASGTIKAVFIFIDFKDDMEDRTNSTWPVGTGPNFLNSIVDETETQNSGTYANVSTFFNDQSFGQFKMIGKAYYVQAPESLAYYKRVHPWDEVAYSSQDVIQILDQSVNFSDFDRWISSYYSHSPGTDGKVDMVFFCYRRWYSEAPSFSYEGWWPADLPGDVYVDSGVRRIGGAQTVDVLNMIQYPDWGRSVQNVVHEFGHVWGLNHQYAPGMWALMGQRYPSTSSFMNAFERAQLGWIVYHDITSSQIASLRDFGAYGDAYRISLGNGEYFILENHQRNSIYDNPDVNVPAAKGLYTLRQFSFQYSPYAGNLKIETADGRFNWSNPSWGIFPGTNVFYPTFQRGVSNRTLGSNDRDLLSAVNPNTGQQGYYYLIAKVDEISGQTVYGSFYKGDGKDAFNLGFNTVFTPWSNPSACSKNGTLSNVGIEILPSSTSTLDIQFFIGNPLSASPSRPQDVRTTSVVNGSTSLVWTANPETDVSGYNIYRGVAYSGSSEPTYTKINSLIVTTISYTDNNYESIAGLPQNIDLYHRYRITAVDNEGKESVKSEYVDAYFTHVANGSISSNRTWQIDVRLVSDATVTSGNILTVFPSTTVKVVNGYTLTINGKLIAKGDPNNRITFTSNNSNPSAGD